MNPVDLRPRADAHRPFATANARRHQHIAPPALDVFHGARFGLVADGIGREPQQIELSAMRVPAKYNFRFSRAEKAVARAHGIVRKQNARVVLPRVLE